MPLFWHTGSVKSTNETVCSFPSVRTSPSASAQMPWGQGLQRGSHGPARGAGSTRLRFVLFLTRTDYSLDDSFPSRP